MTDIERETNSQAPPRFIVTGGAGFIGSHVVDRLIRSGTDVLVFDNLSTGSTDNLPPTVALEEMDISDPGIAQRVREYRPDAIVHAAANASTVRSTDDPVHDARTNILGTIAVARSAAAAGARFVYITTGGALYGHPHYLPCDEDHPIEPLSPYGMSKWAGEWYVRHLLEGRAPATILRLANVYGPRQRSDLEGGVVSIFIDRLARDDGLEIHGDGSQTRDFVHVDDVVDAVVRAATIDASDTLNIGTGRGTSINELVTTLGTVTGRTPTIRHGAERVGDVRDSRLDPTRAKAILDWEARVSIGSGLAALWAQRAPMEPNRTV